QSEFLGLARLELLVDQLIEDLLAGRSLVRRQLIELAALLDVECRDRLAVDDDHHLLGVGSGCQQRRAEYEHYGGHQFAAGREPLVHHGFVPFLPPESPHPPFRSPAVVPLPSRRSPPPAPRPCLPPNTPVLTTGAPAVWVLVVPPSVRNVSCIM